jgi:hypothetical protein
MMMCMQPWYKKWKTYHDVGRTDGGEFGPLPQIEHLKLMFHPSKPWVSSCASCVDVMYLLWCHARGSFILLQPSLPTLRPPSATIHLPSPPFRPSSRLLRRTLPFPHPTPARTVPILEIHACINHSPLFSRTFFNMEY